VVEWLLDGEPWVVYRTLIALLDEDERDKAVVIAKKSIHKVGSDFDFGQKEKPSKWITLLALRIIKRIYK